MSITEDLANFVAKVSFNDLPEKVVHQTKRVILDTICCALAGYKTVVGQQSVELVKNVGGKPESTVVGSGHRVSCPNAAFANAKMANALDFEGTIGDGHPAPMVLFSGLAVGERKRVKGKELITAVAVGIDIFSRIDGSSSMPEPRYERARTCGLSSPIFGAVSSAGKILGLDAEKMLQAFGIAGAYAPISSSRKFAESPPGPLIKYVPSGWLTLGGIFAALLAQKGHTGYTTILDGDTGFWRMKDPEGSYVPGFITAKLGEKWFIMDYIFKYFPCCHWQHGPLHLLSRIIKEQNLKPGEIDKIVVREHPSAVHFSSSINHDPCKPENLVGAQFSPPYNVAMIVLGITPGPLWIDSALMSDPRVEEIARNVVVEPEPTYYWPYNRSWMASSIEVLGRGKTFRARTYVLKGDSSRSETYMTDDELKEKCRKSLKGIIKATQVKKLIKTTYNIEKVDDLRILTELLSI